MFCVALYPCKVCAVGGACLAGKGGSRFRGCGIGEPCRQVGQFWSQLNDALAQRSVRRGTASTLSVVWGCAEPSSRAINLTKAFRTPSSIGWMCGQLFDSATGIVRNWEGVGVELACETDSQCVSPRLADSDCALLCASSIVTLGAVTRLPSNATPAYWPALATSNTNRLALRPATRSALRPPRCPRRRGPGSRRPSSARPDPEPHRRPSRR